MEKPLPILKREQLNAKIVEAVQVCGWNVLFLSGLREHPFRIRIWNDIISHSLSIYSWNLTHGGKNRNPDEYRIQVKVNQFIQDIDFQTLILGWWDEVQVFAGFDIRKHSGPLGYSSSIQVSQETLRKAVLHGISAHDKGNEEIAVTFRPEFFTEYVENLRGLHGFGESLQDLQILESATEEAASGEIQLNESLMEGVSLSRQTIVRTITQRIRKGGFKNRVLTAYGFRCAFCSVQLKLIDAAHIVPVAHEGSTDETANGLALCPLHHRAYDNALITINGKYESNINNSKISYLQSIGHDGGKDKFIADIRPIIHLPPDVKDRPHLDYIKKANQLRGWQ
jgi:putative restriction endonuclease